MLYFRLIVFILLNEISREPDVLKTCVSIYYWCFYKNKCYPSNLICSDTNKLG